MRFKIDWASLIVEGKFTVFALFYFVFEGNFPNTNPRGLIYGGTIEQRGFCVPVWGAYIWRGLFSELYGIHMLPATYNAKLVTIETSHRNWPSLKMSQIKVLLRRKSQSF